MLVQCEGLKFRDLGFNQGLPMVHYTVTEGKYDMDTNLYETVLSYGTHLPDILAKTNKWMCIETPEDTKIPSGLGTFITSLRKLDFKIDLHIHNPDLGDSSNGAPAWIDKPSTVCVDYKRDGNLNYYSLSKDDIVFFHDSDPNGFDQTEIQDVWDEMKYVPCTRWLLLKDAYSTEDKKIMSDYASDLICSSQGSRLTWVS